jgi:hypothetical protein
MKYDLMKKVRISRERLFAQLRGENIVHLGMVKRLYMEANGAFTLIQNEEPTPGLMVLPDWDKEFVTEKLKPADVTVCKNCGPRKPAHVAPLNGSAKCPNCKANEWTQAVMQIESYEQQYDYAASR